MFPPVWQRVVRGDYRSAAAVVSDHVRLAVVGETYPALVGRRGASVAGIVYFDVDENDIARLDAFEGTDYRRASVPAEMNAGDRVSVDTYLYLSTSKLSDALWQPESFDLHQFIQTYCRTHNPV